MVTYDIDLPTSYSGPAYRVRDGHVLAWHLPRFPEEPLFLIPGVTCVSDGVVQTCALRTGGDDYEFKRFTLAQVAEIATRLTPWATWYMAPGFTGSDMFGAMTWGGQEVVVMSTAPRPALAIETTYHEAWHLCEHLLSASVLARLDAQLATGPEWPDDFSKDSPDYWRKPCERRARAFAHYSMYLHEGGTLAPVTWEQRLFEHVRCGAFGREILAARAPTPVRAPGAADVVLNAGRHATSWLATQWFGDDRQRARAA